jgi:hypothetical protein
VVDLVPGGGLVRFQLPLRDIRDGHPGQALERAPAPFVLLIGEEPGGRRPELDDEPVGTDANVDPPRFVVDRDRPAVLIVECAVGIEPGVGQRPLDRFQGATGDDDFVRPVRILDG